MREALLKDELVPAPLNIFERVIWLLRRRPRQLCRAGRGYLLFYLARFGRTLLPIEGAVLGKNVRLQRNGSLVIEAPDASIKIADHGIIYEDARLESYGQGAITIGPYSIIGDAHIVSRYGITIGARFLSSWNVFIQDYDSHPTAQSKRAEQVRHMTAAFRPVFDKAGFYSPPPLGWHFPGEPIVIGDDVWVGAGATILKGARIGDGCIIATGAVVLRGDYPPRSLLAGNPARVVKAL